MRGRSPKLMALACAVALAAGSTMPVAAQTPNADGNAAAPTAPATPPISEAQLARVRRALNQNHDVNLTDQQLRFYLEVVAKQPTFAEYATGDDFVNGPTQRGDPMSHSEFLNMVTPKEMHSQVGITPMETLQFAITNALGQALIRKALDDVKNARDEREVEQIRERIDRELAALSANTQ
jgi:hypothetical protein